MGLVQGRFPEEPKEPNTSSTTIEDMSENRERTDTAKSNGTDWGTRGYQPIGDPQDTARNDSIVSQSTRAIEDPDSATQGQDDASTT